ncbi:Cytochrome 81E8 [Capsicum annuum]|nr:Cytochrome 81E8 [Capsicum annuum]
MIGKYIDYNYTDVVFSPYGDHWRSLRRLYALEIFSSNRLNNFQSIRQHEVKLLIHRVFRFRNSSDSLVELKSKFYQMSYNIIMRMVAGKRYYGEEVDNEEANHFRELVEEAILYGGTSNLMDFMPAIFRLFYRSPEKNLARIGEKMDALLQGLIDEHHRNKSRSTMIDHLLSLQESQPEYYTDQIIKGVILDPESFKTVRFESEELESWKPLPFGMERRACPNFGIAQRVVGLALGTMIQCFEWKRVRKEKVDLTDGKGVTMPKAEPLMAKCKARDIVHKVLSEIS